MRQSDQEKPAPRSSRHTRNRLLLPLYLASFVLLGPAGCANLWDDVTSRDLDVRSLFIKPDPMEVLAKSKDGDRRARALQALREPKQYGGTDAEQENVITLLTRTAVNDPRPLCRLAALESLGRFKDPRAAQALVDAYYAVTELRADAGETPLAPVGARPELVSTFSPDMVSRIQCQALKSLGESANPMAVELLTTVAREPRSEGLNKQQATDARITATRALGRFQHYQATETLVHLLATEKKDVALRGAANDSLQAITGKKLPPDAKEWEDFLRQSGERAATPSSPGLLQQIGFFSNR